MMLSKIDPRSTAAWPLLEKRAEKIRAAWQDKASLVPAAAEKLRFTLGDMHCDLSRHLVDDETLELLVQLAAECRVGESVASLFNGDPINETEKRSVLHTALRNFGAEPVLCNGNDVMPGVRASLKKIRKFCKDFHAGTLKGYTGKRFRYIVNIGIGGSDLGPRMVTRALAPYQADDIETFFVSNVDGSDIESVLKKIRPDRTLFLVASKTFTTQETRANAEKARSWFLARARREKHIAKHFVAISTNLEAVTQFGISPENIFGFEDWVGGRFSLWGPVGLSIALSVGYKRFEELLRGAYATDLHFRSATLSENVPVLMALLGIWYSSFLGAETEAVLPYDQRLEKFPAYLQQASMESNGKSSSRSGQAVEYGTAPVTWGEPGTNGQHAFFQLLHQGTQLIPCDFIGVVQPHHAFPDMQQLLLSNLLAQAEALFEGRSEEEMEKELAEKGLTTEEIATILPFRIFHGRRPSSVYLLRKLTPYNLGSLIALYEHKIFVQGIIWNIFSFDQWGVELGKQLAAKIHPLLSGEGSSPDPRTASLVGRVRDWQ